MNSCGSGLTASVNYVAQELIGVTKHSIYDGSWAEFGSKDIEKTDIGYLNLNIFKIDCCLTFLIIFRNLRTAET